MFNGRVTQISPMGVEKDNVTTFEVRVSIDNPGKELKANMTANAEIVLEEHPNSLIVPEAAITYDAQKQRVRRRRRRPARRTAGGRCRSRSASATARRSRSSKASRQATRSSCPAQAAMREAFVQSLAEPARQQAAQLPHDVRHPLGDDLGRHPVGDRRRLPARQRARCCASSARTSASSGAAAPACRPAASAPAAPIFLTVDDARALAAESSMIAVVSPELERGGVARQERLQRRDASRVTGIEPQYQDIRTIELEYGRNFTWTGRRAGRARRDRRLRHGRAAVRQAQHPRRDAHAQRRCRTRSSARSGRRIRTATTAAPTTTRSSCRSRRWRSDLPRRDAAPGVVSDIIVAPKDWVVDAAARACSTRAPAGSKTSTGRSSRTSARVLARRHGFDPDDRRRGRDVGHLAADADVRPDDRPHEALLHHRRHRDAGARRHRRDEHHAGRGARSGRARSASARRSARRRRSIQRQFFLEGFFLTLLSGGAGMLLALGLCRLVNLAPMPDAVRGHDAVVAVGAAGAGHARRRSASSRPPIRRAARRSCRRSRRCGSRCDAMRSRSCARSSARRAYGLYHHRFRAALSMLGISWGIVSVVVLLAYGDGFRGALDAGFRGAFSDGTVVVVPGPDEPAGGRRTRRQARARHGRRRAGRSASCRSSRTSAPSSCSEFPIVYGNKQSSHLVRGVAASLRRDAQRERRSRAAASSTTRTCGCAAASRSSAAKCSASCSAAFRRSAKRSASAASRSKSSA